MLLISIVLNSEQRIPLCLSLSSWKVLTDLGKKKRKEKAMDSSSLSNPLVKQLKESIHRRAGQPTQAVSRLVWVQCELGDDLALAVRVMEAAQGHLWVCAASPFCFLTSWHYLSTVWLCATTEDKSWHLNVQKTATTAKAYVAWEKKKTNQHMDSG